MELSHRDQWESCAGGGFLPANTLHPLIFHCYTILYLFTTLEEETSSLLQSRGSEEIMNSGAMTAYLSVCLLCIVCLAVFILLYVFHGRRPICGLCIGEAEFSPSVPLTWCPLNHTGSMHPKPSQCINPWMLPGAVWLHRVSRLLQVLRVCRLRAEREGRVKLYSKNQKRTQQRRGT